mgnify:CR=1 FL=1
MILVDLNQVLISNLMAQTRGQGDVKPNEEMIRHMVMNSLRGFNQKFKNKYGNMVLCSDAGNTWRRDIFPQYKYKRKKDRTVNRIGSNKETRGGDDNVVYFKKR